jgi:hypothetical protein
MFRVFLLLSIVCGSAVLATAEKSSAECEKLGFTEFTLCSTCRELHSYLTPGAAADALADECASCCQVDAEPPVEAEKARIVVDEAALGQYGELNRFVEERAKQFGKAVEVTFVTGMRTPEIRLFAKASDSRSASRVVVSQWSTDDIAAYIEAHLTVV